MKTSIFSTFTLCLLLASSCHSNSEDVLNSMTPTTIPSESHAEEELNAFFLTIDSLNNNYAPYKTRNIRKWGTRFLCAVVDGGVGCIASAATTPIGGTIIGTGASWLYEDYLNGILDKAESVSSQPNSTTVAYKVPAVTLTSSEKNMTFVDSIGYYHNQILAELSNSGKTYIAPDGEIKTEELFADISAILDSKHIYDEMPSPSELATFSSPLNSFINTLSPNEEETLEKCFSSFESQNEVLGISTNELSDIKEMCSKISNVIPYLENEKAIEYGENLYKIIDESNISETHKQNFKILDNIFVNSKLYWDTAQ